MEPVPTQTAYADSDQIIKAPISKKKLAATLGLLLIGVVLIGAASWFFWIQPQQEQAVLEENRKNVTDTFNTNDLDGALAQIDTLLSEDPNDASLLTAKAIVLAQKGSLEFKEKEYGTQAVVIAESAIAANPNSSQAYHALGYAYEIQQNYPKAHENYQKALAIDPGYSGAVFSDAHAYDLEGNMEVAEKGYLAAIALNPDFDQAHAGLGRVLIHKGDLNAALAEYKQAFALAQNARNKSEAAYIVGVLSLELGDLLTAKEYATEATTLDPTYPLGWFGLGKVQVEEVLSTQRSRQELNAMIATALESYTKSLSLNPNQSGVYLEIAQVQFEVLGKSDLALAALANAEIVVSADISLNTIGKDAVRAEIKTVRDAITKAEKK